jgi:hypothetical protein
LYSDLSIPAPPYDSSPAITQHHVESLPGEQHWYDKQIVGLFAWILIVYSFFSLFTLLVLWTRGFIDCRLNVYIPPTLQIS